ncbi:response regulator [Acetobacteraceae bacterium H6797]|nr:response regulator [Acetobacteraceae bacterium H6797]
MSATSRQTPRTVVLVVEDEALQRHMAISVAQEAGMDALAAADVAQALTILESRQDIGIVLTDLDMPNWLEGQSLATEIKRRWPEITLMVTSGWHQAREVELPAGTRFFPKPYKIPEVVQALREAAQGAKDEALA